MRTIFADTFYWTALLNPRDEWHIRVISFSKNLFSVRLVTTDEVLTEFLNFFSGYDMKMRQSVIERIQDILQNDYVQVIPHHDTFLAGLEYRQRFDKQYSLTDCISMQTMKQLEITEVLTHDKHFTAIFMYLDHTLVSSFLPLRLCERQVLQLREPPQRTGSFA